MEYKNNPVTKGITFEKAVEKMLKMCGLTTTRTNVSNEYDPAGVKAGYDGGVDIIATYDMNGKLGKARAFYIQCKNHKEPLTKTAVSEVYAGMHDRTGKDTGSVAVVVCTSTASEETRKYAKSLGVELITRGEYAIIQQAMGGVPVEYNSKYGILMKIILFHYTKESKWFESIPYNNHFLDNKYLENQLILQTMAEMDAGQSCIDKALDMQRQSNEKMQVGIDVIRQAAFSVAKLAAPMIKKAERKRNRDQKALEGG